MKHQKMAGLLSRVDLGQPITAEAYGGETVTGTLARVEQHIDPRTRVIIRLADSWGEHFIDQTTLVEVG